MGLFDSFFSGDSTTTSTNTTSSNIPDWYKNYLNSNTQGAMSELEKLANTTADQRIQGFTADELAAQERTRSGVGQYDDIIKSALSTLSSAQNQALTGDYSSAIQNYMNPYSQDVIDISKRKAVENADVARAANTQAAGASSGFGGSGNLLRQTAADKQLSTQLSDLQYQGLSDAYDKALAAAQSGTQTAINAAGQTAATAQTGQNIYNTDTSALNTSGQTQRALEQQKTDFTYTNPLNTYLQGSSLLNANAGLYGTTSTGTQTTPTAGWGSQLLGAATTLGGAYLTGGSSLGLSSLFGNNSSTAMGAGTGNYNVTGGIVGKKDGGVVKMANGGEPMAALISSILMGASKPAGNNSLVLDNLSPQAKAVVAAQETLQPTTSSRDLTESDFGDLLPPRTTDKIPVVDKLPSELFTTTSPKREAIKEETAPAAASALAILGDDKPLSEQTSKLDDLYGGIGLPLMRAGLAMMASNKPFGQAVGEGGLAGLDQYVKDRQQAAENARLEQKAKEESLDRQIKQKQLDELIRNNAERRDIAKQRLEDSKERTKVAQQNADTLSKRSSGLSQDKKLQFDTLKTQLKSVTDRLNSGLAGNEEIPQLEQMRDKYIEQMNSLVGLSSGKEESKNGNIQDNVKEAVKKVVKFNAL